MSSSPVVEVEFPQRESKCSLCGKLFPNTYPACYCEVCKINACIALEKIKKLIERTSPNDQRSNNDEYKSKNM